MVRVRVTIRVKVRFRVRMWGWVWAWAWVWAWDRIWVRVTKQARKANTGVKLKAQRKICVRLSMAVAATG